MQSIIKKLDLVDYIDNLQALFAREKSIVIQGDINIHFSLINEISRYEFKSPPKLSNLDRALALLQKQGVLKLDEIYEFIKIIKYFIYLNRFSLEGKLSSWIEKIIVPDDIEKLCDVFDDKGQLTQGYNDDFDMVIQNLYNNKVNIKDALQKVINGKNLQPYLVDHQVHLVHGEQTLLVRGGFNHVLKAKVLDRSTGGFFFVLPHSISDLKQKQSDLENLKSEIVYKICQEYSILFRNNLMFLKFVNKEFDRFDHYISRVHFAAQNDRNFILPSKSHTVQKLVDFKHPALKDPKPVSIDFTKNIIMITGVNAGGKTMLLKSILSAVFMSKYLIPYNCGKQTKIGSYKEIQAVLDDPQSVKNDISTFAGRMVEFSRLFTKSDVIVGVDEIELGTDSDEAASLFKVIIEQLESKNIKIIITTHHKRLAALMARNEQTQLIAALYDEENRKPTYEFLQGTIGKSYAFETASRYGIPHGVVQKAKDVYGKDKDKLNDLIERSSQLERELSSKIKYLDEQIDIQTKLNSQLNDKKENADKQINEQKAILQKQYQNAIDEAKKIIKNTDTKDAHRLLNNAHKKASQIKTKKIQEPVELKIGDRVKYNNTKGVLISIKGTKATIDTDQGMKLQVKLVDLRPSGKEVKLKKVPYKQKVKVTIEKPKEGFIKLDLHGQRGDEACENLDKFISDSLINGFDEVLVYHGIGTGKLAHAVKEFLDVHPRIISYEDAPAYLGGFGAKVIKL
ncbi:MAG: endonuclease MutS2 [Campylobacteraceae bacterium]|nr:endonuclease MutS2 [Campylobacteraceae bacterium]MBT3881753.1 endonuclease MutS2 [Campylobacteraceae bacterium]MBT4030646.1 endonuclease MutS2 [Campylobacteraceae bacterium]MBT4178767.1 endonuclease MutS2 [Campylobacteraceae bacterium]MBT4708132.1 endonuclease MutS2 [Campylobacteraceae bacterium]